MPRADSTIIYLVVVETGEYDEYQKDILKAYRNERNATRYVNKLTKSEDKVIEAATKTVVVSKPDFLTKLVDEKARIKYKKVCSRGRVRYSLEQVNLY